MLEGDQRSKYRGIVARANKLAQDRSDTQFAVKEFSRPLHCWGITASHAWVSQLKWESSASSFDKPLGLGNTVATNAMSQ